MNTDIKYQEGLELTEKEAAAVEARIEQLKTQYSELYRNLKIEVSINDDGDVVINHKAEGRRFERIRRITGYLVGTIDRWNNAKQAEEHDRVKHAQIQKSA
jgi:hypothetical protein